MKGRALNAASVSLLQRLQRFQALFRAADGGGNGILDQGEFLAAFRGHLSSDDQVLRRLFMEVDSNCDGLVSWEELSAHLLLEKTGAASAAEQSAAAAGQRATPTFRDLHTATPRAAPPAAAGGGGGTAQSMRGASSNSSQPASSLSCLVHAGDANGGAPDRWYSAGSDGVVQVWNGKDLSLMRSYQTSLPSITSATYLPSSGLLALGSYSRSLLLLDPATGRQAGCLPNVASTAALSLTAWSSAGAGAAGPASLSVAADGSSTSRSSVTDVCRDLLAVGDADGSVGLMQLEASDTADKKTAERFTARKLWHSSTHRDWVVSLLHCPQISSVAAASLDKTLSLTDLERSIAVRVLAGHTKAVHCCAWNSLLKVVASGSSDRRIMLWNPFSCRALGALAGHAAPVVALASNERDMQIICAAADNTVKVWDLRNQRCLQTLQLRPAATAVTGGHHVPLSVMAFNPAARTLVAGAARVQGWVLADGDAHVRTGHKEAVSWVGCIEELHEVVSTDHGGMVCCWDLATGRLRHSFSNTQGSCRISTARLDSNCRRLITGFEDGSIRVWNAHSGALLSTLSRGSSQQAATAATAASEASSLGSGSGSEVTGLAVASSTDSNGQAAPCIVATGWDRKVTWYADRKRQSQSQQPLRAFPGPDSDVLAAAAMPGHPTLATACANGEVWLWNLDSGAVTRKLLPPGLQERPHDSRAVEAVAFMHADLRHILIAVGADCVVRFWDTHCGHCLEHPTQGCTAAGEALCAVAVAPDNCTVVTADTTGHLTVWDVSSTHSALRALTAAAMQLRGRPGTGSAPGRGQRLQQSGSQQQGSSRPQSAWPAGASPRAPSAAAAAAAAAASCSPAAAMFAQQVVGVRKLAGWRAHQDAVTTLVWVPQAAAAAGVTAAEDTQLTEAEQEDLDEEGWAAQAAVRPSAHQPPPLPQQHDAQTAGIHALLKQLQPVRIPEPPQHRSALQQQQRQVNRVHQQPWPPDQQPPRSPAAAVASCLGAATAAVGTPAAAGGFVLSAGLDRSMVLWSSSGARVGTFGTSSWQLQQPGSWQEPPQGDSSTSSSRHQAAGRVEAQPAAASAGLDALLPYQQLSLVSPCSSSSSSQVSQAAFSPRAGPDAAAAAVAAAMADAAGGGATAACEPGNGWLLPPPQDQQLDSWQGLPQQQQQQQGAGNSRSVAASPRSPCTAVKSVAVSELCTQQSAAVPAARGVVFTASAEQEAHACGAAEEHLPTSLWLPEFALLSRPATAGQHAPASVSASASAAGSHPSPLARPSTAGGAMCGSAGRLNAPSRGGSVLATAGRTTVMLGGGAGAVGGVLSSSKACAGVPAACSSSSSPARPRSAGMLQGKRRPGSAEL